MLCFCLVVFVEGFFKFFGGKMPSHPWGLCKAAFGVFLTFLVGLYKVAGGSLFCSGDAAPVGKSVYICFVTLPLAFMTLLLPGTDNDFVGAALVKEGFYIQDEVIVSQE